MAKMRKVAGVKVRELNKPVRMEVVTKVPAKWMLTDMETNQTYIGTGKKKIGEQWREIGPKRHDWLQGRTEKQYTDSMTIAAFAALGIFTTILALTIYNQLLSII